MVFLEGRAPSRPPQESATTERGPPLTCEGRPATAGENVALPFFIRAFRVFRMPKSYQSVYFRDTGGLKATSFTDKLLS